MEKLINILSVMSDYKGSHEINKPSNVKYIVDNLSQDDKNYLISAFDDHEFIDEAAYPNFHDVTSPSRVNSPELMSRMKYLLINPTIPDDLTDLEYCSIATFVTAYLYDAKGIRVPLHIN